MYAVQKVANLEDEVSCNAYEVFQFTSVNADVRHVRIARAHARNWRYVYRALLTANAALPANEAEAQHLIELAVNRDSPKRLHHASNLGWRPGLAGFTFWDEYIPPLKGNRSVLPPIWAERLTHGQLVSRGSLKAWQKYVAVRVTASPRLLTLAAAAFAAPLVHVTGEANFGINLFGLSASDSDIAATLVGSILGAHPHEAIVDWWVSPSALVDRAQSVCDLLFFAGGAPSGVASTADKVQRERLRRLRTGSGSQLNKVAWRGLFVTLLPHSHARYGFCLDDEAGRNTCIEIPPATAASTLLDSDSDSSHAASALGKLRKLARAAARHRGTPMRRFVRYLVKNRDGLAVKIRLLRRHFVQDVEGHAFVNDPGDTLSCYSLLFAGAAIAIEAGILPWSSPQAADALKHCLAATLGHQRTNQLTPAKIRGILRQNLQAPNVVRRDREDKFGPDRHAGYVELVAGRRRFTIHARAYRRWFGSAARCATSLAWLHKQSLLVMGNKPARPTALSGEWAERTPRWPDGSVQKSFVFYESPPRRSHRSVAAR